MSGFVFDSNIPKPAFDTLKRYLKSSGLARDIELKHLFELGFQDHYDEDWVPKIAHEPWVIISGDKSKSRRKGMPLRLVAERHNLTCILLSNKINSRKMADKASIFISIWSSIEETANAAPGSVYMIESLKVGGLVQPQSGRLKLVRSGIA